MIRKDYIKQIFNLSLFTLRDENLISQRDVQNLTKTLDIMIKTNCKIKATTISMPEIENKSKTKFTGVNIK